MRVIITKGQLLAARACAAYLDSPEWDEEQEALVYKNWDKTVKRLASNKEGLTFLGWLVGRSLVPMPRLQFRRMRSAIKAKARAEKGEKRAQAGAL